MKLKINKGDSASMKSTSIDENIVAFPPDVQDVLIRKMVKYRLEENQQKNDKKRLQ